MVCGVRILRFLNWCDASHPTFLGRVNQCESVSNYLVSRSIMRFQKRGSSIVIRILAFWVPAEPFNL